MSKFHINPNTGNPGPCSAEKKCPYGDLEKDHYPTPEIARTAYEVKMKTQELEALQKNHAATVKARKKSPITDAQVEKMKKGWFNNRIVSFRHGYSTPSSMNEHWDGKLVGEPDDVDLVVNFTKRKMMASLSWEGQVALVDSIDIDNIEDLTERDKAEFMLNSAKKAKTKYADRLAKDRDEVFKRAAEFDSGEIYIDRRPMKYVSRLNSYGEVEGSRWIGEKTPEGYIPELTVLEDHAILTVKSEDGKRVKPIHSEKLVDGYNNFRNGTEAARFLIKADEKLKHFTGLI